MNLLKKCEDCILPEWVVCMLTDREMVRCHCHLNTPDDDKD